MGNKHEHREVPITQEDVDRAGRPHQPLAPQSEEQRAGGALLGSAVRALVDGRMQTIFLTEFDLSSHSYHGMAARNNPAEGDEPMPKLTPVHGLRPYPYVERPNYSWQFVRPGDDESVLINIAAANMPQARAEE